MLNVGDVSTAEGLSSQLHTTSQQHSKLMCQGCHWAPPLQLQTPAHYHSPNKPCMEAVCTEPDAVPLLGAAAKAYVNLETGQQDRDTDDGGGRDAVGTYVWSRL